jgi:NitT/TauT family transport system permease protein
MKEAEPDKGNAKGLFSTVIPPTLTACAVLGLWYFFSLVVLSEGQRFLLPAPHQVVETAFFRWRNLEELLLAARATSLVTVLGLSLAIWIGMMIAISMSQARWFERTFFPYAVAIQAVPIIAIVPVIGLWMGFSFAARVLVTIMISIFPIITNTLFGLKSIESNYHDLFTLHKASRSTRLLRLQLPGALPAIFTGFRISAGLGVVGAIVGEFFFRGGKERGIGRLLATYQARLQIELLVAGIFFSSLLGVALFVGFSALSNRVLASWRPPRPGQMNG